MRIDELRSTLHEHGDVVGEESSATRLQAVHGRVSAARRRRAAVAAGGAVAAVAAVALAVVPGLGERPGPGPAQNPPGRELRDGGYVKDGVVFRDDVLGEKLLGAAIGDPGQAVVSFDIVAPDVGLRFSPLCYGVGPEYLVRLEVEGHPVSGSSCTREKDTDPGATGSTIDADPRDLLRDWGARPGDVLTVELSLQDSKDRKVTVLDTDAVIGAGVYEDTRPRQTVAGVEVPELIEHEGREWRLVSTFASEPGSRRLWIGAEGGERDTQHLILVATSGFKGETVYEIRRDGRVVDGASQAAGAEGPSWQTVGVFRPRVAYELELTVQKGLTERTRLAFVAYEPVA